MKAFPFFSCSIRPLLAVLCLAAAAPATRAAPGTAEPRALTDAALFEALKTVEYSSSAQPFESLDLAIVEAGQDAAKLAVIESHLLALLHDPATTFAARQAICQRLGGILPANPPAAHPALALLAPMLSDEKQCALARLALDRLPGPAVDMVYRQALARSTGPARLALVQSIGFRRIGGAVGALALMLKDADPALAAAAAAALGQIATADALKALQAAPDQAALAIVDAQLACARQLPAAPARAVFQAIQDNPRVPLPRRAAAFRSLLDAEPAAAAARITRTLAGDNPVFKAVALEAVASLPARDIVPALLTLIPTVDAPMHALLLAALGRKGDATAVPAVVAGLSHTDAAVRLAALTAVGFLPGSAGLARQLARVAAGPADIEAKAARASLTRLNGLGVDDAVLAGAAQGEATLRVVFLEQIALRNLTEGLPLLLTTRRDADATVRAAAVGALGELATPAEQAAVLDWAVGATDAQEQIRAVKALTTVALRDKDETRRAQPVLAALARGDAAVKQRLLPVLPRLGGRAALDCAAQLALDADREVAAAAIAALGRWTGSKALLPLVVAAEKTSVDQARRAAVQGALRQLERSRELPPAEQAGLVSRLLEVAPTADARKKLVVLLGRGADDTALALAEKLQTEAAALVAEARDAADAIRANREGPPKLTASAAAGQVKNVVDRKTATRWSVPATSGQWIQLDFKMARPIHRLTLDQTGKDTEFPEKYEVFVMDDPQKPGDACTSGSGKRGQTVIDLPAKTRGRYVIIKNTEERRDSNWSISELYVD